MNNRAILDLVSNCREELNRIDHMIKALGAMSSISGFLTKYAIITISGTLEKGYKDLIADYYESLAPSLSFYLQNQIRESSCNPSYQNIINTLNQFDEGMKMNFKNKIKDLSDSAEILRMLSELNDARNKIAHGQTVTMSFNDAKERFEKTVVIIETLDDMFTTGNALST